MMYDCHMMYCVVVSVVNDLFLAMMVLFIIGFEMMSVILFDILMAQEII